MIRDKAKLTKTSHILLYLLAAKEIVQPTLAYPSLSKAMYPELDKHYRDKRLDNNIRRLCRQGWIKFEYREAKKVIALTNKGQLEALFEKAKRKLTKVSWDGKWRLLTFDIPEDAKAVRERLRMLLKSFGFIALQASVYVYPYPLSAESIEYFKASGLMRYIRIAKAEFDDDTDLRKIFKVLPPKSSGR